MARLPVVGGDQGEWGTILNEALTPLLTWTTLYDSAVEGLTGNETESGGTWVFADGVISQTDDTLENDVSKILELDLAAVITKEMISGLTGLAIIGETRSDTENPITSDNPVAAYVLAGNNNGLEGGAFFMGLASNGVDDDLLFVSIDNATIVDVGEWSVQTYTAPATSLAVFADGEVMYDTAEVPEAYALAASSVYATLGLTVGQAEWNGHPLAFGTQNGAASFRLRLLGLYGLPDLPA